MKEEFEKEWIEVIKKIPDLLENKIAPKSVKNLCYGFFLAGSSVRMDIEIKRLKESLTKK
mgnify:CR=1 FL=1